MKGRWGPGKQEILWETGVKGILQVRARGEPRTAGVWQAQEATEPVKTSQGSKRSINRILRGDLDNAEKFENVLVINI